MPEGKEFWTYEREIDEDGKVTVPSSRAGKTAKVVTNREKYYLCESTVREDGTVPVGESISIGTDFVGETVTVKVE